MKQTQFAESLSVRWEKICLLKFKAISLVMLCLANWNEEHCCKCRKCNQTNFCRLFPNNRSISKKPWLHYPRRVAFQQHLRLDLPLVGAVIRLCLFGLSNFPDHGPTSKVLGLQRRDQQLGDHLRNQRTCDHSKKPSSLFALQNRDSRDRSSIRHRNESRDLNTARRSSISTEEEWSVQLCLGASRQVLLGTVGHRVLQDQEWKA